MSHQRHGMFRSEDFSPDLADDVIDFLEQRKDFFCALFEDEDTCKWIYDNNTLSNNFFLTLFDKFSAQPKLRDRFKMALIGVPQLTTPCLKNGNRASIHQLLCEHPHLMTLLANNRQNPAIEKWYQMNVIHDDHDDPSLVIEQAIDFLEERKEFFCSLFEDFLYSAEWVHANKNLSKGFFDALNENVFHVPRLKAEFRIALLGDLKPTWQKPCLNNGHRDPMRELLNENTSLAYLMVNNLNNPAIELWYKQHATRCPKDIGVNLRKV